MPTNIKGIGAGFQRTEDSLHVLRIGAFTATEEKTFDEVKAYPTFDCAPLQDVDIAEKESSMTVTLETGSLDEESISWLLFNNKFATSASIALPEFRRGTIVGGAVANPDLAIDRIVEVTVLSDNAPGNTKLTRQPQGTGVTPTNFEVSAGQLDFDASLEGKSIAYYYRKTYTNIKTIGGENYDPYVNIEIAGKICGTRFDGMKIWFPRCTSLTGVNFDPGGDSFSREYKALIPTELNFSVPYIVWGFAPS